ncbi:metal-sulfur cluster assembly factor [Candidatus Micrarchaeota archaeon]|nr:metal-sulfur cluster assembly factor [Candidatus Micrarchaeota archaeon]
MVTKKEILEKMSLVTDPELGINIVDLGLVYDIDIRGKEKGGLQKVFIKITFTTPACPLISDILEDITARLDEFKDLDIEVSVVFDPPWSPDRMSERAKIKLGMV